MMTISMMMVNMNLKNYQINRMGLLMLLFVEACSNSNPKKHISYHVSILGWLKLGFIVIFLPAKLKDTFGLPPTQDASHKGRFSSGFASLKMLHNPGGDWNPARG